MRSRRGELAEFTIIPMASCSLGAFCLEAGIDMRELPGSVGVIILAHKAWQQ